MKALGERIVANELTYRGWLAVNTNSGEANSPNIDLIALRGERRVTIQVKSTRASSHKGKYFLGYYREDGKYFNSKEGPLADFVVAVRVESPSDFRCLVLPASEATRICEEHGTHWLHVPKKDGGRRSSNFPLYVGSNTGPSGGLRLEPFADAWHQFE